MQSLSIDKRQTPDPSPLSKWSDPAWRFASSVPGQQIVTLRWDVQHDGQRLLDDRQWTGLLYELRATAHIALTIGAGAGRLEPTSLGAFPSFVRELFAFYVEYELESLSDLDSDTSLELADFVATSYTNRGERGTRKEVTHATLINILKFLTKIWELREPLRAFGVVPPPEAPFAGETPYSVVTDDFGLKRKGRLIPIHDQIAFPLMNAAAYFCGTPASDVNHLQDLIVKDCTDRELLGYTFGVSPETMAVWRPSLQRKQQRSLIDGRSVTLSPRQFVRHLVLTTQGAAAVVLQSATGMRAHELCSLEDTNDDDVPYPSCLTQRPSIDGSMELFYVQGTTAKRKPASETEWLIGSRPAGSTFVPVTVQALMVLHRILSPWRRLAGIHDLFLTFSAARGFPQVPQSVGRMTSQYLTYLQKEFLMEHVDLSGLPENIAKGYVRGAGLRGHRWRPTFAINIYRTDSRLIPALRSHFKHMNDAVTSDAYIGNDAALLDSLDSVRTIETTRMMLSFATGGVAIAGSMAATVNRYRDELVSLLASQPGDTDEERARYLVLDRDVRIWDSEFSACLMSLRPEQSKCHNAIDTPTMFRQKPNVSLRTPDICIQCGCCVVRPEHESFWKARLEESAHILHEAKMRGPEREGELRVQKARHHLAKAVVEALAKRRVA